MKAINHKDVIRGYLRFSVFLMMAVAVTQLCISVFFFTSEVEVAKISVKMDESERIYNEQNYIVENRFSNDYLDKLEILTNI